MSQSRWSAAVVLLTVAWAASACGKDGGARTPTSPTPTVTAVAVSGCTSAENFQCRASAQFSNGTSQDVTGQSQWASSDTSVATVSASGVVTVIASGAVEIRATYQGVNGTARFTATVTPRRFVLDGRVREEAPTADIFIPNATIRVLDGPDAGVTTTSDGNAYYVFRDGVTGGTVNVQVSAAGYETRSQAITGFTANRSVDLFLRPILRIVDETLSGTISGGDAACAGSIANRPCRRFSFGTHHSGTAEAVLSWNTGVNDLDLELWSGNTRIASSTGVSRNEERVSSTVGPLGSYQWRVVYFSGSTVQAFTLRVRRPN